MTVSYTWPLERAWTRTRSLLFGTLGFEGWLVLGFAAFLAGLVDTGLLGSWRTRWNFPLRPGDMTEFTFFGLSPSWWREGWLALLVPFAAIGLAILIALLWAGSRGKFVFLDDALHGRAAIVEPWQRFRALGDSLFVWRVGLWLVGFVVLFTIAAPLAVLRAGYGNGGLALLAPTLAAVALAAVVGVAFAVVVLLLESFVVPIMYARNLTCTAAWRFLLPLLRRHLVEFTLYVLFVLLLWVLVVGVLFVAAALTCCITWPILVLMALPYVKSVVLLPLSVTFRLFTVEFLAQFGPDYFTLPPLPEQPGPGSPQVRAG